VLLPRDLPLRYSGKGCVRDPQSLNFVAFIYEFLPGSLEKSYCRFDRSKIRGVLEIDAGSDGADLKAMRFSRRRFSLRPAPGRYLLILRLIGAYIRTRAQQHEKSE